MRWAIFLCFSLHLLESFLSSGHFMYPGIPPIFTHHHQSQAVFQGSSASFGFGGLPPISSSSSSSGGIQLVNKPEMSFSTSYHGSTGGNGAFPASGGGGSNGGSIPAFVQSNNHGGNGGGWIYPGSPFPIGKPYPPPDAPITNELRPSITSWDTNYKVPCGTYKIHPDVVAHLRYNSGVPFEMASMAKSGLVNKEERSDIPSSPDVPSSPDIPASPPKPIDLPAKTASSPTSSASNRQGRHLDFTSYYNLGPSTCTWDFYAVNSCKLKFSCPWFQLPALFQCDENMIELSDAEQTSFKFCGNRKPRGTYSTTTDNLKLTFTSRPYSLPSVFHCTVQCIPDDTTTTMLTPTTETTTTTTPKPEPPLKFAKCKCGVQRSYSSGRIVGGSRTGPGEFPWTVALVKQKSNRPFCGGALINNQYVLSAAHCVQHSSMVCDRAGNHRVKKQRIADIEVLLNEYDISSVNMIPGGTVRSKVTKIIIHPKYDNFTYNYDVAVLKLEKAIDFGRVVDRTGSSSDCDNGTTGGGGRAITEELSVMAEKLENKFESQFVPICLPSKSRAYSSFDDKEGIVTGWGYTKEGGVPSSSMMQATVNIFNDSQCQDFYRSTDVVTKQMICAGHPEGKMDSCVGDSGGPLAVKEQDQYTLAGLVSWGRGCGRANLPGVYTRMNGLTEWIESEAADAVWCQP